MDFREPREDAVGTGSAQKRDVRGCRLEYQ